MEFLEVKICVFEIKQDMFFLIIFVGIFSAK